MTRQRRHAVDAATGSERKFTKPRLCCNHPTGGWLNNYFQTGRRPPVRTRLMFRKRLPGRSERGPVRHRQARSRRRPARPPPAGRARQGEGSNGHRRARSVPGRTRHACSHFAGKTVPPPPAWKSWFPAFPARAPTAPEAQHAVAVLLRERPRPVAHDTACVAASRSRCRSSPCIIPRSRRPGASLSSDLSATAVYAHTVVSCTLSRASCAPS